jgi:hypothetical protein
MLETQEVNNLQNHNFPHVPTKIKYRNMGMQIIFSKQIVIDSRLV